MTQLDYVDAKTIAKGLGVSARSVYRWAACGSIPSHKLGTYLLRFSLAEVAEWVESGGLTRAMHPAPKAVKPKVAKRRKGQEPDLSLMGWAR